MSRFSSQIAQYQSNNRGKVPSNSSTTTVSTGGDSDTSDWGKFIKNYMRASGDTFDDPDGESYKVQDHGSLSSGDKVSIPNPNEVNGSNLDHVIRVYHKAHCEGEDAVYSSGDRNLAFFYQLEGTGVYCGTN